MRRPRVARRGAARVAKEKAGLDDEQHPGRDAWLQMAAAVDDDWQRAATMVADLGLGIGLETIEFGI